MKLNKILILICCVSILTIYGCGSVDKKGQVAENNGQITTQISVGGNSDLAGEKVISMKIDNGTNADYRILKWNSPFEETFLGDYLNILDQNGTKVEYHGPMVKRRMPPPEESYLSVPAGKSIEAKIDFSKAYTFDKPGKYTVQFEGSYGADSIPPSNIVEFEIK